jgi:hypothetical protein
LVYYQHMEPNQRLEAASRQLDRVEAKASFVFAVDSTLLTLVGLNFRFSDIHNWVIVVPAIICIGLATASLVYVYRCSFPHLESVSKLYQGLQSFRSMRRMEASFKKARPLQLRFSQSLARRRQRLSQAIVRSTIQRLGSCTNPDARSDRLMISVLR